MSNKYLEKIAEAVYNVRPSSSDRKLLGINSVNLSQEQLNKYYNARQDNTTGGRVLAYLGVPTVLGTTLGMGAEKLLKSSPHPLVRGIGGAAPIVGAMLGLSAGGKALGDTLHDEGMEAAGAEANSQFIEPSGFFVEKAASLSNNLYLEKIANALTRALSKGKGSLVSGVEFNLNTGKFAGASAAKKSLGVFEPVKHVLPKSPGSTDALAGGMQKATKTVRSIAGPRGSLPG